MGVRVPVAPAERLSTPALEARQAGLLVAGEAPAGRRRPQSIRRGGHLSRRQRRGRRRDGHRCRDGLGRDHRRRRSGHRLVLRLRLVALAAHVGGGRVAAAGHAGSEARHDCARPRGATPPCRPAQPQAHAPEEAAPLGAQRRAGLLLLLLHRVVHHASCAPCLGLDCRQARTRHELLVGGPPNVEGKTPPFTPTVPPRRGFACSVAVFRSAETAFGRPP